MDYTSQFAGKSVLITGGLGFIGSNLAHRLVELDARVTIIDSMIPDHGGNLHNLCGIRDRVQVNVSDLRDPHSLRCLIPGHDYLFNLAGQVSHRDSMERPLDDLEINVASQLSLLESCRKYNPGVRLVFSSTRQLYGRPQYLPVDEKHPVQPVDVNGINKMAAEWYHVLYQQVHGLRTTALRLSNVYGPRQLLSHGRQGFIAGFIRCALQGSPIQVYADGEQKRDLTHVSDIVEALLMATAEQAVGQVYNAGSAECHSLRHIAELLCDLAGNGSTVEIVSFPPDYQKIDIGDFATDSRKILRELGWQPRIGLREGLAQTLDFYRCNRRHYLS